MTFTLSPAWRCLKCGHESFCGYFASQTVCPKCPDRPEMQRAWGGTARNVDGA
jgi:hypothetical protein